MIQITTSKGKWLFVEVPIDAYRLHIHNVKSDKNEYLCTTQNITEEQAAQVVDRFDYPDDDLSPYYPRYDNREYNYADPISSFNSLLRANKLNADNYAILKIL